MAYPELNILRPCDYRDPPTQETKINMSSGCCKGKKIVIDERCFCRYYDKMVTTNNSSACWTCTHYNKD